MKSGTAVVVGGGIGGMLSALLLSDKFEHVYIVEASKRLGGLLNSLTFENEGYTFDYGTHLIGETGTRQLDELFLNSIYEHLDQWFEFDKIETGTVVNGILNEGSNCINTNSLPSNIRSQGVWDLLEIASTAGADYDNMQDQLYSQFGKAFTDELIGPAMFKCFNYDLNLMAKDSHLLFMSPRIIISNPDITTLLKQLPYFDDRIAYHSVHERNSGLKVYYPKSGGIGTFIRQLESQLKKAGVRIILNDSVIGAKIAGNKVTSVKLMNVSEELKCDHLVWTLPLSLFFKVSGAPIRPEWQTAMKFRGTKLYHFVFDKPFLTSMKFITCYDPDFKTYRVTLYSNINPDLPYQCTVEVLTDADASIEKELSPEAIIKELRRMRIVDPSVNCIFSHEDIIPVGFPIRTKEYTASMASQEQFFNQRFANVSAIGRAASKNFFMKEILQHAYTTMNLLRPC